MSSNHLFLDTKELILASASPRRKKIMEMLDLDFTIKVSSFEEEKINDYSPVELVKYNSKMKSNEIGKQNKNAIVVGADTVVVKGNRVFEKPNSYTEAFRILRELSDSTHEVLTGFTILDTERGKELSQCERTSVKFDKLSERLIEYYLDNYKYSDKAGSYAIQDFSAIFVKSIEGCYYNVMGFPISAFGKALRSF